MQNETNIVWLDLELTGLDVSKDTIVEIATIITDKDLNILAEGPDLVIHHSELIVAAMGDWQQKQFTGTGLINEIRESKTTLVDAEEQTLAFVKKWLPEKTAPLAGNTIWMDRVFLMRHMPHLHDYFHYRNIDVSTVKELARKWKPELLKEIKKEHRHRALSDIRDSINELMLYKKSLFS
jgi:oligoribonuclease